MIHGMKLNFWMLSKESPMKYKYTVTIDGRPMGSRMFQPIKLHVEAGNAKEARKEANKKAFGNYEVASIISVRKNKN